MKSKRTARTVGYFSMFLLLSGTAFCSGDFAPENAPARGVHVPPEMLFSGEWNGYRMILDRNGNIRETVFIERACTGEKNQEGVCLDRLDYEKSEKREQKEFFWKQVFLDYKRYRITVHMEKGQLLEGKNVLPASVIYMEGEQTVPGSSDQTLSAEVYYQPLSGPGRPVMETRQYYWWWIHQGTVQTFWRQK